MIKLFRILYKILNFDVMSIATFQFRLAWWVNKKRKEQDKKFLNPEIDVAIDRTGRVVPTTSNDITLRPTVLKRALVTVAVLFGFAVGVQSGLNEFPGVPMWAYLMIGVLVLCALIHFCTYELRYNRDQIIGRGMMLNRLEYRWVDLKEVNIVDDRTFHLVFENGDRMQIYKSLQDVDKFMAHAQAQARQNRAAKPAQPTAKTGWQAFGSRKTFP